MKKLSRWIALALLLTTSPSYATTLWIMELPTKWRLENYVNDVVHLWYTSSKSQSPGVCTMGQLALPAGATSGDKNRLWAAVSTAKVHDKKMFVSFESTNCIIVSFGILEE